MGGASSLEREKTIDASDIGTVEEALLEIIRLRQLARSTQFPGFEAEKSKPEDASDITPDLKVCIIEIQRLRALIKSKIPTAERLKKQRQLENEKDKLDTQAQLYRRRFDEAVMGIADVTDTQLSQIRAVKEPTEQLRLVMEAVATLIYQSDKKKSKKLSKWMQSRDVLVEVQFREKLNQWDLDKVKPKARKTISKICDMKILDDLDTHAGAESATVVDVVCFHFMQWVRAIDAYCKATYSKRDGIRQLEVEIKSLRTPEEELGERFMEGRMPGLRELHGQLDDDGNGTVSFKELQRFLTRYNCKKAKGLKKSKKVQVVKEKVELSFEQTKKLTQRGDVDGKYVCAADLDFPEFVSFMLTMLHVIFCKIDRNRNGTVEVEEVKDLLTIMYGQPTKNGEHQKMFKKLKKSAKGQALTQDVFTDFMIKTLNSKINKKKAVLPRLLTMAVSDKDWQSAKETTAKENFIQFALAAEADGQNGLRAPHGGVLSGPPSSSPATNNT